MHPAPETAVVCPEHLMSYFLSPTVAFPLDFLASIFLAQKCYSSSSLASSIQALLLWAAIPALIPKAQSRRQINSMLPGEKCFCILWMTQMCSMVMTVTTEISPAPAQGTAKNLLKGKQLLLSKQFFKQEEQLAAQTLDPMQNPVVMKWLQFWRMLLFVHLFT